MATPLPVDLSKVDPEDAWKPWTPTADEPWDRKRAAHLFRRGGFGATPAQIENSLKDGFPKTFEKLVVNVSDQELYRETFDETKISVEEPSYIRAWWLYWMHYTENPLREKLTLFWHNHFATSYAKIKSSMLMVEQNISLRKHALGKFRPFLLDMSKDTAMLIWLDSNRNVKGAPNENFAREVMELFSLGVGNYTEKDIQEAARAFTGWHHNLVGSAFEYNPGAHDLGPKTVLGQTGDWTGSDIIRICCDQPACARFLVGKLYTYLVSEAPPPKGLLTPLEERFRKSDYDIADLMKAMLGSRFFFSSHAYRKRVKWPAEYVMESFHSLTPGIVPPTNFVEPMSKMGQPLFSPPNVKGWRTGTDWLNSATLLARNNFAETVALGEWSRQGSRDRGAFAKEPAEPEAEAVATVTYSEESTLAIAGGAGSAAVSQSFTMVDSPAGKAIILSKAKDAGKSAKTSPPPAPPSAGMDPVVTLYATKPKDIPALVARMSDLLYGERMAPAQMAKIEKFLREPLIAVPSTPPQPKRKPGPTPPTAKTETKVPAKVDEGPGDANNPAKTANAPDLVSPEFKARVREALHAMMCLPEYQLN